MHNFHSCIHIHHYQEACRATKTDACDSEHNLFSLLSVGFGYLVKDASSCVADYGFPFTSLSGYHNEPWILPYSMPFYLSYYLVSNNFQTTESYKPFQTDQFP